MSVYKNDSPEWFETAVMSVINQTSKPSEIILIRDGEVPEKLNNKINELVKKFPLIKLHINKNNLGLGLTLQKGIELSSHEIIARMDSDDYSVPTRFETQLKALIDNDLDLVGSHVKEFVDDIENVQNEKKVPITQEEIKDFAKSRNPFCHPSVMFRKSKVLESGNYQDMKLCEDYYLWIRMIQKGCKVANIDDFLVYMRVSLDLYARRGGYKYYKSQKQLLKFMWKTKFINWFTYTKNTIVRFIVQVLMPNKLRQKFYEKKLRK